MVFHQPLGFSFFSLCFVGGEVIWKNWHVMLLPPNAGICLDFDGFSQVGANDNKHHVLMLCSMGSIIIKRFGHVGKVTVCSKYSRASPAGGKLFPWHSQAFQRKTHENFGHYEGLDFVLIEAATWMDQKILGDITNFQVMSHYNLKLLSE